MIATYGLTHVALAVRDAGRAVEVYRGVGFMQVQTPGSRDVLVFEERDPSRVGTSGGIAHFGFRLRNPEDIDAAARAVRRAGGTVKEQGEFVPGEPYLFATDPDGYEIEIWYELPTPADPPRDTTTAKRRRSPKKT
jgi:catechol 2,3-dioxygenase-like lactoylglutathione lyase family enzyme